MADLKLFQINQNGVVELESQSVALEKSLQTLIERNLETFLGVRFLKTEHSTGKTHGGRIDTLGLDENNFPVIIEYKRALNEDVISQGLYYMDWLLDHQAEFKLLVLEKFGQDVANKIEWSNPRLLCIAGDFTKYHENAVKQINRSIELIRYRKYGDNLLLFELVNAISIPLVQVEKPVTAQSSKGKAAAKTVSEYLDGSPSDLQDVFHALEAFLLALGDDVQKKTLQLYIAYKRIKNFACVEVHPQAHHLLVFLKIDPDTVQLQPGFARDVRNIGHFGTGDLELKLTSMADLERAKQFLITSYENS